MKRLVLILASFALPAAGATVDSADFGKMIQFTVSGYAGSSTLENFPVLVRLSASIEGFDYADAGATAQAAAASLRFADADGNNLDYEIDTWDSSGTSLVWVSVPEIAGTTTRFFVFYKPDAGATLPAVDPTAVWTSAGYVGVWHMNAVEADGLSVADATGNGLTATAKAAAAAPTLVADGRAPFGNCVKGGSGGLYLPASALLAWNAEGADKMQDHYSAEFWVDRNASWQNDILMSTGDAWNTGAEVGLQGYLYGNQHHNAQNNKIPGDAGVWSFVAATWASSGNAAYLFCGSASLNGGAGAFLHENLNRTDTNTDFTQFSLNSYASRSGNGSANFPGYMDEFRLRRVASSKDWAQAVWASGKAGSTFLAASPVVSLDAGILGGDGSATGVSCTTATITGVYVSTDPTSYPADWTLSTNGVAVRSGSLAALAANGTAEVALDDLVPDTAYEFSFSVEERGASVYSVGSFATAAPPAPTVSGVGDTTATATFAATLSGASYAAGTVTAVFAPVGAGRSVSVAASFADGAWTATATTLEADQDYAVTFVVAPSGRPTLESPASVPFTTTGTARVPASSFSWEMSVTATGYAGSETLTNFPVLVRVSPEVAARVSSPDGIRFALADGTLLPHDVELWNPAGVSAIWVSVPELSGTDTSFLMLWDPVSDTVHGAVSPTRVWTAAGYVAVYHFNAQNADGSYPDASGNGATAVAVSATVPNAPTTATLSTNGTPWHLANVGLRVLPENTTGWTFSSTGYTTEAWLIPTASYNRMFLGDNSNERGNTMAFSPSQVYVMNGNYDQSSWPSGLAGSAWRFVTTAWRYAAADWNTRFYANAEQRSSWSGKNAVDFTANGMGLTSGTGGNGAMNYSVDEIRVRRGNSTADWVKANYDTQVLGSSFLSCSEPERVQKGTLVIFF